MAGVQNEQSGKKPLKILTLDGGGLQALSTLSILSKLCDDIAARQNTDRKPLPAELFDVIAGIGTGGWLALLLGRYRLNLSQAMAIYLELAPQLANRGRSFFPSKPYTLDQKRLVTKVDNILQSYGLKPFLLDDDLPAAATGTEMRCKHAFAVGTVFHPRKGQQKYEIFRSYEMTKTSGRYYHPGPNPRTCQVSAACAATGATRFLLEPYTIGSTTYSDDGFPNPHNITELAMDEAYHIFGDKPPISLIVNIGPGIPNDHDIEKLQFLSRQFSWPYWLPGGRTHRGPFSSSPKTSSERTSTTIQTSTSPTSSTTLTNSSPETSQTSAPTNNSTPQISQITPSPSRSDTASSSSSQASEVERQIEKAIKSRLYSDYGTNKIFTRLAPPAPSDDVALNDVQVIDESSEHVENFLALTETKALLDETARLYCVAAGSTA